MGQGGAGADARHRLSGPNVLLAGRALRFLLTLLTRAPLPHLQLAAGLIADRVPERVVPGAAAVRGPHGLEWTVGRGDNLQRSLYLTGSYEPLTLRLLERLVAPGATILDVGANIGAMALPLAASGRRVIAVEPQPEALQLLRHHVERNGLAGMITIVPLAFGRSEGELAVRTAEGAEADLGRRFLAPAVAGEASVPVIPGDRWLSENGRSGPLTIKIDVEGAELDVLIGLRHTISIHRPPIIVEVIDDHLRRFGSSKGDLFSFAESLGYRVYWLRARGLRAASPTDHRSGMAVLCPMGDARVSIHSTSRSSD